MSDRALNYELDGKVAVLSIDDGRANAIGHDLIDDLNTALERAEKEAHAVLIIGRPGRFSAGFDLSVMTGSVDGMQNLVKAGADMLVRLYMHPQPVVAACTGHALAAGALILLVSDTRIGVKGDFKLGLNEVAIGMGLPIFGIEFARDRLSKRHLTAAVSQGTVYSPDEARDVGYLDTVVAEEALIDTARTEAQRLAELATGAVALTKITLRGKTADYINATLEEDIAGFTPPVPKK
jgi:enoyl-CoA hydratase